MSADNTKGRPTQISTRIIVLEGGANTALAYTAHFQQIRLPTDLTQNALGATCTVTCEVLVIR